MLVAHVWLLAIRRLECKAPWNQNVRYLYLPSLDLVQIYRLHNVRTGYVLYGALVRTVPCP